MNLNQNLAQLQVVASEAFFWVLGVPGMFVDNLT